MTKQYPEWFKPKGYLHLMPRITYKDYSRVKAFVSNPKKVKNYNFYPLIHRTIITRRYKKLKYNNCDLQLYRSHVNLETFESTQKERDIHFPNHLDGLIYSYYAKEILSKLYETELEKDIELSECITAYRKVKITPESSKGKCNIHFAYDVFNQIRKLGDCVVLAFDIEKFFPSLNHLYLRKAWSSLLERTDGKLPPDHYQVFKALTSFWYVEEDDLLREANLLKFERGSRRRKKSCHLKSYCTNEQDFRQRICGVRNKSGKSLLKKFPYERKGIPQGTAISALLANIYLLEFDKLVYNKIKNTEGAMYRRYSDDIIVVCPQDFKTEIKTFVEDCINKSCNLTINSEKTEEIYFSGGKIEDQSIRLRYLGFEFAGEKMLIKSSTLSKYYRRMKYLTKRKFYKAKVMALTNQKDTKVWSNQIRKKYSDKAKRNFIAYAKKAEKETNERPIILQIKSHKKNLEEYLKTR